MDLALSRRHLLKASLAGIGAGSFAAKVLAAAGDPKVQAVFQHGVASGEPGPDSVLLWTRISGADAAAQLSWQLADDDSFNKILQQGQVGTDASCDFTVKVDVQGLEPGQTYYYRFLHNGVYSEPGRTRTTPVGKLDKLCIAVASCSNYPFGYFNAYEVIAADRDIDFILHLGDYIYEYGNDGYGADVGKKINRAHQPSHEIVSLADYRQRHAQYKADPASRLMHAAHPLIPTWDDHESTNNPHMQGAQNHQPSTEGDWGSRRRVSVQAYYEWMPVREPGPGRRREQLWRHFQFGDLASLVTLETRHTGRSLQVDYKDHLGQINSAAERQQFLDNVLAAPGREMLSADMKTFYGQAIASEAVQNSHWHLLGNQIPMARTHVPDISTVLGQKKTQGYDPVADEHAQFRRLGELDMPIYLDTWDGYPGARERFYQHNREHGINDLLVLTGDSHSFWTNSLYDGQGRPMGLELGTAGITSPGDFESYDRDKAARMDQLMAAHNKEVEWTDNLHRGFVKLSLSPKRARAEFISVDNVLTEKYKVERIKTAHIEKQNGHLVYRD